MPQQVNNGGAVGRGDLLAEIRRRRADGGDSGGGGGGAAAEEAPTLSSRARLLEEIHAGSSLSRSSDRRPVRGVPGRSGGREELLGSIRSRERRHQPHGGMASPLPSPVPPPVAPPLARSDSDTARAAAASSRRRAADRAAAAEVLELDAAEERRMRLLLKASAGSVDAVVFALARNGHDQDRARATVLSWVTPSENDSGGAGGGGRQHSPEFLPPPPDPEELQRSSSSESRRAAAASAERRGRRQHSAAAGESFSMLSLPSDEIVRWQRMLRVTRNPEAVVRRLSTEGYPVGDARFTVRQWQREADYASAAVSAAGGAPPAPWVTLDGGDGALGGDGSASGGGAVGSAAGSTRLALLPDEDRRLRALLSIRGYDIDIATHWVLTNCRRMPPLDASEARAIAETIPGIMAGRGAAAARRPTRSQPRPVALDPSDRERWVRMLRVTLGDTQAVANAMLLNGVVASAEDGLAAAERLAEEMTGGPAIRPPSDAGAVGLPRHEPVPPRAATPSLSRDSEARLRTLLRATHGNIGAAAHWIRVNHPEFGDAAAEAAAAAILSTLTQPTSRNDVSAVDVPVDVEAVTLDQLVGRAEEAATVEACVAELQEMTRFLREQRAGAAPGEWGDGAADRAALRPRLIAVARRHLSHDKACWARLAASVFGNALQALE